MIDRLNLPNEVEIFTLGNRITFVANRPYQGSPAVNTTVMIVVQRAGVTRVISVAVNLTPHNVPIQFHVIPNKVVINDHQLVGTFLTTGQSTDPITIDRTGIPAAIGIEIEVPTNDPGGDFMNHNGAVIIRTQRPVANQPPIQGIFPLRIMRQGMTRVVIIEVNLTPLPFITLLSQGVVSISDTVLSTSVTVGGTSTGTITADSANALPSNITLSINQSTNIITITATRPTIGGSGMNSTYLLTVSRGGATAPLVIETNLTPLP